MKFVTDLNKGILGAPDSPELWSEVLSNIPDSILKKPNVRILVMACGHATEAIILARRMLALGVNKKSAKKSIWLIDKYQVFTNPAKKIYGFENVVTEDFLNWNPNMKFDAIVGNPPFQSGNGESGGKHSLWRKFVKKSFELCADDGYVGIVCPGFPYKANDIGQYFTDNTPLVLNNDVSGHFPGVGSDIKYWVVKQGTHTLPFVVDGKVWSSGLDLDPTLDKIYHSILKKLNKFDKFECKQDRGYNSTQFKNDDKDYFDKPKGKSIYPIRHASTVKVCYVKTPTECHNKRKVMMTFSGYPAFEYYDETTPMSSCYQMSGYIEVANKKEANSLIEIYQSELYTFLSNFNSAGMKGAESYCLPKLDLTRSWTNDNIYQEFKLTKAEISYIQANL